MTIDTMIVLRLLLLLIAGFGAVLGIGKNYRNLNGKLNSAGRLLLAFAALSTIASIAILLIEHDTSATQKANDALLVDENKRIEQFKFQFSAKKATEASDMTKKVSKQLSEDTDTVLKQVDEAQKHVAALLEDTTSLINTTDAVEAMQQQINSKQQDIAQAMNKTTQQLSLMQSQAAELAEKQAVIGGDIAKMKQPLKITGVGALLTYHFTESDTDPFHSYVERVRRYAEQYLKDEYAKYGLFDAKHGDLGDSLHNTTIRQLEPYKVESVALGLPSGDLLPNTYDRIEADYLFDNMLEVDISKYVQKPGLEVPQIQGHVYVAMEFRNNTFLPRSDCNKPPVDAPAVSNWLRIDYVRQIISQTLYTPVSVCDQTGLSSILEIDGATLTFSFSRGAQPEIDNMTLYSGAQHFLIPGTDFVRDTEHRRFTIKELLAEHLRLPKN